MSRHALLLFALLALTGCQFKTFDLADEWAPLKQISERPSILAKDSISTTIGDTLYVEDLERFWLKHPEGSADLRGLLKHEREHSVRQYAKGVALWLACYVADKKFMWNEERRGWYLWLTEPGVHWIPEDISQRLAGYQNAAGQQMVDEQHALDWLYRVRSGSWKPDQ